jgi:hypothetical protein
MQIEQLKRYQRINSAKRFLIVCKTCMYQEACQDRMGWNFRDDMPCVYHPSRWKKRLERDARALETAPSEFVG